MSGKPVAFRHEILILMSPHPPCKVLCEWISLSVFQPGRIPVQVVYILAPVGQLPQTLNHFILLCSWTVPRSFIPLA